MFPIVGSKTISSNRILDSLSNFIETDLLPTLAAILPWPWCFRFYKLWLRQIGAAAGESPGPTAATQLGLDAVPGVWAYKTRLLAMVDRADEWLSRTRGDAWLDRYVRHEADPWPTAPFLAITYHFGAGLWALRHLRRNGHPTSFLSARLERTTFSGTEKEFRQGLSRLAEVAKAGGAPVIYTGGAHDSIVSTLERSITVVGLIDIPVSASRSATTVPFLGRQATLPNGLVRIAYECEVPIVVFVLDLDWETGYRVLRVRQLPKETTDRSMARIAADLEENIRRNPPSWHQWPGVEAFFNPTRPLS